MDSLPTWLQSINDQLEEQYRAVEVPFEELISAYYESLQREEAALDEQNILSEQLQRHQNSLRITKEELESLKGGATDNKKFHELDSKYRQVKAERIELLRIQSQNTQKLLELNDQMKEQQFIKECLEEEINKLKASIEDQEKKFVYFKQLLEEKNLNIQILQDELQALQLELLQTDEKVKLLQSENQQLVQRWLSKVNETVDKLNAEFSISKGPEACLAKTNLDCQVNSLATAERSDLIYIVTKDGGILSKALETTINLSFASGSIPKKAVFSKNADLLIGFNELESEVANIWNIMSGKISGQLTTGLGKDFINFVSIPTTNDAIISIHKQDLLRLYDLPRTFCLWTEQIDSPPRQLQPLRDDLIILLTNNGRLQLWDIKQRKLIRKSSLSSQLPNIIDICSYQNHLVAYTDRSIISIDPFTFNIVQTIPLQHSPSHLVCHDTTFVTSYKSTIVFGNHQTGKIISTISDHDYPITGLNYITVNSHPVLVSADSQGTIALRKIDF